VFEVVFGGACTAHVFMWFSIAACHFVFVGVLLGNVFEGACTTSCLMWLVIAIVQCVFWWMLDNVFDVVVDGACATHFPM
jgi:hypothetical protein